MKKTTYANQPGGWPQGDSHISPPQGVKGSPTRLNPMGAPVPGYSSAAAKTPGETPEIESGADGRCIDYGPNYLAPKTKA